MDDDFEGIDLASFMEADLEAEVSIGIEEAFIGPIGGPPPAFTGFLGIAEVEGG